VSDVTDPERKGDEILVNVRAAGLNSVDLLYVRALSLLQCIKT
jgi:NADPH:quinone reductase-like Zn-dependent oxidoreductase